MTYTSSRFTRMPEPLGLGFCPSEQRFNADHANAVAVVERYGGAIPVDAAIAPALPWPSGRF